MRWLLGVFAACCLAGCRCNTEAFGVPIENDLGKACTACPTLDQAAEASRQQASRQPAGKCSAGAWLKTTCADGHLTVTSFNGVGYDVQHFDASGAMIGLETLGGVRYGKHPDCVAKAVVDFCGTGSPSPAR